MYHRRSTYLLATRHPWSCFLFLLPLLAAYEGGVWLMGGARAHIFRNGADAWLRGALEYLGLSQLYLAPLLIAGVFVIWSILRRRDRPADLLGVETGMAIESIGFALGLWAISRGLAPMLDSLGVRLELATSPAVLGQVITYVGAGIYEELLFRLLLYSGLLVLLRWLRFSLLLAVLLSAVASSALFSAAHHIGPYGEGFDNYVFLFRMLAGLYFALLYQLRGFGIAVGAHACYDVVVGVVVTN
jgi:membrane protease YdiL (CAAX protease family)